MNIGTKVYVDDGRSVFCGVLLNTEDDNQARIRDDDTGDVLVGSWDFVEPIQESGEQGND